MKQQCDKITETEKKIKFLPKKIFIITFKKSYSLTNIGFFFGSKLKKSIFLKKVGNCYCLNFY